MMVDPEVRTKGDVLPALIEYLWWLSTDPLASSFNRFEAIELLLRIAMGPRCRPSDSIDAAASNRARIALSETAAFLNQTMTSNANRARVRLHAASSASLVTKVSEVQI
jgi:hypothetical protein